MAKRRRKNPAAVALGRRGGKVRSDAKALTSRENGKRGGRPSEVARLRGELGEAREYIEQLEAQLHHCRLFHRQ